MSQIDLMATFADVVNFDLPDDCAEDSHSLLPLLAGHTNSVRTTHIHNTNKNGYAIRHGDWVLIDHKDGYVSSRNKQWETKRGYPADNAQPAELYNLKEDIGQKLDRSKEYPEKVAAMKTLLKNIREQGFSAPRLSK